MSSFAYTEPVRLAQVGVGYWGRNLLRNAAAIPGAEIVAVCDRSGDALDLAGRLAPRARLTEDVDSVLADPSVEAVILATETPTHADLAAQALEAGKHVFVEKPLAQTTEDAARLVALAEVQGRRLMVGHLLRYHPAYRHVERLVREGTLGPIRYLYSVRVNLGIVRETESAFDSLAPHDLAVALALIPGTPVSVSATGHAYLQPGGPEDVVFASVAFEGGEMAHLHCSWLDPHKVRRTTVVGSEKMAVVDDMAGAEPVRIYDKGVDTERDGHVPYADALKVRTGDVLLPRIQRAEPLRLEVEEFIACVREDREPRTSGREGLAVVRLLDAARRSIAEGGSPVAV
ncbi:MAG TPA: Gfo/Idh/MocA family oxidoreductase [Bacteroidetes bacterium]|nr:Gfo/Idh/MocA family oxidoreductase [Bacteroidota bacterium]